MSDNLIIIPVFPPHFHWASQLLDSASSEENIALGFTNEHEASSFNHSFPFKKIISTIPETEMGFVGKKKLNLLKQVYSDYKYISIIDAEAKFLKPTTPYLEEIWNSNCFLGNHSVDGARIMRDIAAACKYNYNEDLYLWFNCMPIFKTDLLLGFFNWLESKKDNLNSYLGFEFLVFSFYCRYELNMSWRTLEGYAWHGLVEDAYAWKKPENQHLINQVVWSTHIKDIENYPNIKMLFHLDRFPIK